MYKGKEASECDSSRFSPKNKAAKRKFSYSSESNYGEYSCNSREKILSDGDNGCDNCASCSDLSDSQSKIPKNTCDWTSKTLNGLKIYTERSKLFTPLELVEMATSCHKSAHRTITARLEKIMNHMRAYNPLRRLDFDFFHQLREANPPTAACVKSVHGCAEWSTTMPVLDTEQHWSHAFRYCADMLAQHLQYMVLLHDQKKEIPESMYGILFQDFIGMFGIHGLSVPSVPSQSLKICDTLVTSTPDLLLLDKYSIEIPDINILVLCKMIDYKDLNCSAPPNTREQELEIQEHPGGSENVIGQHAGELFLHYPYSSYKTGLMGMIVQGTHITFTYLKCNEEQFDNIKIGNGNVPEILGCPIIRYSRKFNFLKASDREELIEPLLKLGLIQCTD